MTDNLQKLEDIVKVLGEDVPSTKEVVELFQGLMRALDEVKAQLLQQAQDNKSELDGVVQDSISKTVKRIDKFNKSLETKIGKAKSDASTDLDTLTKNIFEELASVKDSIPEMPDIAPLEKKVQEIIDKPEEEVPTAKEELESLEGDDRIDKSAIKGLDKALKSAKASNQIVQRRIFQPMLDRFTDETDGATKIFYLQREPVSTNPIEVSGTDFPIILDPTVDFTIVGKKLTLTDAIPAPSSGATLIVKYYV